MRLTTPAILGLTFVLAACSSSQDDPESGSSAVRREVLGELELGVSEDPSFGLRLATTLNPSKFTLQGEACMLTYDGESKQVAMNCGEYPGNVIIARKGNDYVARLAHPDRVSSSQPICPWSTRPVDAVCFPARNLDDPSLELKLTLKSQQGDHPFVVGDRVNAALGRLKNESIGGVGTITGIAAWTIGSDYPSLHPVFVLEGGKLAGDGCQTTRQPSVFHIETNSPNRLRTEDEIKDAWTEYLKAPPEGTPGCPF